VYTPDKSDSLQVFFVVPLFLAWFLFIRKKVGLHHHTACVSPH
jgi:hypothetical protein